MICFRDFTVPLWEIFGGNLLLFVAGVFYIAWWAASFRPNVDVKPAGAKFIIAAACCAGAAAIVIMSLGIGSLSRAGKGFPVPYILLGGAAFFIVLLAVTKIAFKRAVTSELLLITVWAALESSAIAVVRASGRFGPGQTATLAALTALATGAGLVCYVLYYRLGATARFWTGLIPLAVDAGAAAMFLAVLALS